MAAPPSAVLRHLFYDTVALDALSVEFLVRRVGASQVLLGSDVPFPIGNPDPVATICATDLDDTVKQRICVHNAATLASPAR